jgi:pimeloyl-ACP methyl ester carboxylesterase
VVLILYRLDGLLFMPPRQKGTRMMAITPFDINSSPHNGFCGVPSATDLHNGMAIVRSDPRRIELTTFPPPLTKMSFALLREIEAGELTIGFAVAGPPSGQAVILLHGWPYDIHSYVEVAPLLAMAGYHVIIPYLRGYGTTRFLSNAAFRSGQQSALAVDIIALMDALAIERAIIAGYGCGARTAGIIAALWPRRCKALVVAGGYLINNTKSGQTPLPPEAELQWWHQFYFATERGQSGYEKYRQEFAKLMWRLASPEWAFSDTVFERSATALENPDHAAVIIHYFRWRLGLAEGEAKYEELEQRLALAPVITVPTIILEGDANGTPLHSAKSFDTRFLGKCRHRVITGGVGHNLPQEAPWPFAQAIIDVVGLS